MRSNVSKNYWSVITLFESFYDEYCEISFLQIMAQFFNQKMTYLHNARNTNESTSLL